MELDDFLSRLDGVRHQNGGQVEARCPAHDDSHASLSLTAGKHGGVVLKCHAGCAAPDIVAAMGLTLKDLMGAPFLEAVYPYFDLAGVERYRVERWGNPKDFRGRLPEIAARIPYNLPLMAIGIARNRTIYVVEGEKDCERLAEDGLIGTTNCGGAGKWYDHYDQYFFDANVVIIADNDDPGRAHARAVAANLGPVVASLAVMVPRYGKDVSELLDAGFTLEHGLEALPVDAELGVVLSSNIAPKPIRWAWSGHFAFGKTGMIEGDPGDGKSLATIDMAARWSSGATMPDGSAHSGPFNVLMITSEDDPEDTIVPRLIAAGADRSRVFLITHGGDPSRPFMIGEDAQALHRLVMKYDIQIVTVDPLAASMTAGTDSHNDVSVRQALYPLYRLARDLGVAVIAVRHLNKGSGKAIYRGGGSIGFIGAVRCGFTIGRDADDRNRRIMAPVKMNIAPDPPSLVYTIEHSEIGPFVKWHGTVDIDAQGVIDGDSRSDREEIISFLNQVVQNGEPMTWKEIVVAARDEGYTEKQLRSRRGHSRLVKVVGGDGNRSVRWGYLEHQMAARDAGRLHLVQDDDHLPASPLSPISPFLEGGVPGKTDPDDPSYPDPPLSKNGEMGKVGIGEGKREMALDDLQREADVLSMPLVCEVCGSTMKVSRYLSPYWAVRCRAHSPLVFKEGGIDE